MEVVKMVRRMRGRKGVRMMKEDGDAEDEDAKGEGRSRRAAGASPGRITRTPLAGPGPGSALPPPGMLSTEETRPCM